MIVFISQSNSLLRHPYWLKTIDWHIFLYSACFHGLENKTTVSQFFQNNNIRPKIYWRWYIPGIKTWKIRLVWMFPKNFPSSYNYLYFLIYIPSQHNECSQGFRCCYIYYSSFALTVFPVEIIQCIAFSWPFFFPANGGILSLK